jgi:hypothetical protein
VIVAERRAEPGELSAVELREALVLVLAELRALPRDRYAKAERLGRLQGHIETIVGDSPHGTEPIYGLAVLRQDQEGGEADPVTR